MRQVDYEDDRGRKYRVMLPPGVPDEEAPMGIPVGPPDVVERVGLPEPFATRLHNLLHRRGLYGTKEIRGKPGALQGVLQAALKVDMHILMQAYIDSEKEMPVLARNGR